MLRWLNYLKVSIKRVRLIRYNFIMQLKNEGYSKLPDVLKITNYPLTYQYYDPMPVMLAKYERPGLYQQR